MWFKSTVDFTQDYLARHPETLPPCKFCGGHPQIKLTRVSDFHGSAYIFCEEHPQLQAFAKGDDVARTLDRAAAVWKRDFGKPKRAETAAASIGGTLITG